MKTATEKSAAKFLQARVAAVRKELAGVEERWTSGHPTEFLERQKKTLAKDLLELETRLAEVI